MAKAELLWESFLHVRLHFGEDKTRRPASKGKTRSGLFLNNGITKMNDRTRDADNAQTLNVPITRPNICITVR